MDKNKCKVTVEIFGEAYTLKGDMEAETVRKIAATVDQRLRQLARSNPRLSVAKVAVLTALNLAEEFGKLEQDYQELMELLDDDKR
jgi:cell division protein ZapA